MNTLKLEDFSHHLHPRQQDCHKGDFGRVLIIGGYPGYSGAVLLSALAAMRAGAGSVTVATHPEHARFINLNCPELMCHAVPDANALSPLLAEATAVVIGPGLATTAWSLALLKAVLACSDKAVLYDADALNLIAAHHLTLQGDDHVVTPHPGEAARLLATSVTLIQHHRQHAISQLSQRLGGVVILKGAGTLVRTTDDQIYQCLAGNPGMATAGMGDVLTGIIASFIAQQIPLAAAACLAVLVHAKAGDLAANRRGERGLMASDVISCIPALVNVR